MGVVLMGDRFKILEEMGVQKCEFSMILFLESLLNHWLLLILEHCTMNQITDRGGNPYRGVTHTLYYN